MAKLQQTGRGNKGNLYYRNPKENGDAFQKSERSASKARWFRNFNRTKSSPYMTSMSDVHYIAVHKAVIGLVEQVGDPQTAFNTLMDIAWEIAAKTGNIKDLDATQEANFKTWVQNWVRIAWEVGAQMILRPFLAAVTESSVTSTSATALTIWVQSDWDNYLASIERLDCPDFVYRFMEPFLFYIKMSEPYEKAGLEIPPSYFIPICYRGDLEDNQTLREAAKAVSGNAMIHCRKFGIPFSKFSADKLKSREVLRENMWHDQTLVAYFNFQILKYYDDGDNGAVIFDQMSSTLNLTGANLTDDYTNIKYAFIDGEPLSMMHALYPLFGRAYHATNNPYGEIISSWITDTNEYEFNIHLMKILGTTWDKASIEAADTAGISKQILRMFASFFGGGTTEFGVYFQGTGNCSY